MDFLTETTIGLFIMIVAPGFISLKIWGLIHPSRRIVFSEVLYEAVFYGVLNYFLVVQWSTALALTSETVIKVCIYIISLVVVPVLLPIAWKFILSCKFIKKRIINPIPKAWDVFFRRRKPCFMIVHTKNRQVIGGLYAYDSATSSYPESQDLYLQEIWELDDEGKFVKQIDGTLGLLVSGDTIDYIELFHYAEGE
ncbi:MAG: DUF6338 family protein [Spirochaetaceae bacterium]|jgi:hypothetical protein|nr:DUF6338 family protein [Spirochaetaceae bacterium]